MAILLFDVNSTQNSHKRCSTVADCSLLQRYISATDLQLLRVFSEDSFIRPILFGMAIMEVVRDHGIYIEYMDKLQSHFSLLLGKIKFSHINFIIYQYRTFLIVGDWLLTN